MYTVNDGAAAPYASLKGKDKTMKSKALTTLREYTVILFGSVIYAVAFDWLFVPNNIVMGGLTGLGQTVNHIFPFIPVGVFVIVANIPLFIVGFKLQGIKLLVSSAFAMVTGSLAIDLLPQFVTFHPLDDQLLACLLGGAIVGVGMGLQLWVGATTGGTELAASLIKHRFRHIQIGKLCLIIDLCVIALYTVTFGALKDALYAIIAMYVSAAAMDAVIYGRKTSKVACIISTRSADILSRLLELDLGITQVNARGGYSKEQKDMLICAFKPSKIGMIRRVILELDPDAFIIICDAQEIYGEGFADASSNVL